MFSKAFRVKSNTQLRASERKKLRTEIKEAFPTLKNDDLAAVLPNKCEVFVVKVMTFSDQQLLLYVADKVPILFESEKVLFPSVYFLWKYPDAVPVFTTWPPVVKRLANGADLMLPGVVVDASRGMHAYGQLAKGSVVAINTSENSAPIAVGQTTLSSTDMYLSGNRGRCVHVLHCYEDNLWAFGAKCQLPLLSPPQWMLNLEKKDNVECLEENVLELTNCDACVESESKDLQSALQNITVSETDEHVVNSLENASLSFETVVPKACEEIDGCESSMGGIPEKDLKQSMDQMIEYCFLKAWKTTAKKIELPVLCSSFYKVHMLPACPPGEVLDVKKTTYKKLSKFLASMQKEGVVKLKELAKGAESIVEVNTSHPLLRSFEDLEPMASEVQQQPVKQNSETYVAPDVVELVAVNAAVLPLFSRLGYSKGDVFTASEMRKKVTEYVRANCLQSSNKNSIVQLDPILADVLRTRSDTIKWDELFAQCQARMGIAYRMTFPNKAPIVAKGKLDPIEMTVATRSGNKKVTLVNNLDLFGIDCQEFAHKCQVGVAASTSVSPSPTKRGMQVLVQGNQINFINGLLQGVYKIPKRYIKGLELAIKMKK